MPEHQLERRVTLVDDVFRESVDVFVLQEIRDKRVLRNALTDVRELELEGHGLSA